MVSRPFALALPEEWPCRVCQAKIPKTLGCVTPISFFLIFRESLDSDPSHSAQKQHSSIKTITYNMRRVRL
ncbi:hypothetical protein THIARS_60521 [Thiomonas delicata]|uniref:Uncharacterized protein n=1 Tax=Thiomonas delicata TaxID=364030 RepID=A0A238D3D5_THIDL|nr:hypothetical protein THIARS_60521 [Thiomonas delicata]